MKLHVHTFTWICGLVGCQPSSVAINFLDHVTKWAPHGPGSTRPHLELRLLTPPIIHRPLLLHELPTQLGSLASFSAPLASFLYPFLPGRRPLLCPPHPHPMRCPQRCSRRSRRSQKSNCPSTVLTIRPAGFQPLSTTIIFKVFRHYCRNI